MSGYSNAVKDKKTNFDIDLMFGAVQDEGTAFLLDTFPELFFENTTLTFEETLENIPKILNKYNIDNRFIINDTIQYYTSNVLPNTTSSELR